jgi:hypothetical protein
VFIGLLSLSGLDYRGAFGCRRSGRRCFFGKTVGAPDGLAPYAAYADLELRLREALTVAGPIEQG